MLYPSTLVIVSEEQNSLCFKVSSAPPYSYPSTAAISAPLWLVAPSPPGFPCVLCVGKGFPFTLLPCQQAEGCCKLSSHEKHLALLQKPGGKGAGCQGISSLWEEGGWHVSVWVCWHRIWLACLRQELEQPQRVSQ